MDGHGRLTGKVALITGAGSGIGRGIAKRFAAEGAKIVICGRRGEALEETASQCPEGSVFPFPADVRKLEDAQAMAAATIKFGGKIDILVNDAGIARRGGVVDVSLEDWEDVYETNLRGTFYMMRVTIPHMVEAGGGSIITISSLAGIRRIPNGVSYCATKEGLIGLAQSVAMDYGKDNIRSNVICPGFTYTESVDRMMKASAESSGKSLEEVVADSMRVSPIHRPVPTDEIAQACVFFASDESKTTTGAVLSVDSGTAIVDASIAAMNPH